MNHLSSRFSDATHHLTWATILPALSAGAVIGVLLIFIEISFAAMIFSGSLAPFIAQGIGLMLFGLAFYSLMGVLLSTFNSTSCPPQDGPVAILAVIAAAIVAQLTAVGDERLLFLTVIAAIALTTLLTGVFFYMIGHFRLGNLVRYIPFPVVGGFLAGAGWLLVTGSIGVMVDVPFGIALFSADILIRWLPGLLFAVTLLIVLQFDTPFWTLPALLTGGVAAFYLVYGLVNGEVASAESGGWLLGPFPGGELWRPYLVDALTTADWRIVLGQLPNIGTVLLVSLITFLLNVGALTVAAEQDIDMNRELRSFGIANMLGSLAACTVGYTSVSLSVLAHRLSKGSRFVNILVAALAALAVIAGASFLNFFPRVVAGGFLLFIGLTFIQDWLISARSKVPRLEYGLMWVIVLLVVFAGFLQAVFAGILIATILFAVNYSRARTTRLAVTAESYQSQVQRPLLYQQLLRQRGQQLHILSLQGYIFFGIGDTLVETIKKRIEEARPEFILLDFRLVTGIDSSAMLSISKFTQLAGRRDIHLVFTGLSPQLERRLVREGLGSRESDRWHIFPEQDMGLAWCEEQLIARWESVGLASRPQTIRHQWMELVEAGEEEGETDILAGLLKGQSGRRKAKHDEDVHTTRLRPYLEQRSLEAGETLVEESERFEGLILVETGQVMVQAIAADGSILQVKVMEAGNIVGELGQYARRSSRLAVIATEPALVFVLTAEKIKQMEEQDPPLAIALHRLVAGILSERNIYLDDMVQALQF